MRRRHESLSEAIGTDAFLDIVANLVGILLILLMVIGVRMEDATKTKQVEIMPPVARLQQPQPDNLPPVVVPDPSDARQALNRLQASIREASQEAERLAQLMQIQKLDRDNLMLAVTNAQRELERRRAALNDVQRQKVALDVERRRTEDEYQSLMGQLESLKLAAQQNHTEVLQHLATPIAKTVFVREEHFRLKEGRLLYVPLNEMTNQLRYEAPKKMWKLKTAMQTTETIGPRDGFEMRYTLRRNRVPFATDSGISAVREVVELDRFVMVPIGDIRGETLEEIATPTSSFSSRLSEWNPRETIVTVWTYPDSFAEFRELKKLCYERGFLTAARPLPENQLISGSPHGTRSAAQ